MRFRSPAAETLRARRAEGEAVRSAAGANAPPLKMEVLAESRGLRRARPQPKAAGARWRAVVDTVRTLRPAPTAPFAFTPGRGRLSGKINVTSGYQGGSTMEDGSVGDCLVVESERAPRARPISRPGGPAA